MSKFDRFSDMRFGMFIHWGIYSIPAEDEAEWLMRMKQIPPEQYNRYAEQFLPPADFSPESWVIAAKNAGMRYLVFTTRHHDGFAMHESKVNPFNSVNAPCHRDFVREYVEACRKHGMGVGLYYSLCNWQYPAFEQGPQKDPEGWNAMVQNAHDELRELMTHYGKIDILWYDGCTGTGNVNADLYYRSKELNEMVRSFQPEIMINDRSDREEDFVTPEQSIHAPPSGKAWESCLTMNGHWGYCKSDTDFKEPELILRSLLHCASHGGNLLLNVGPRPDGSIPEESLDRLETLGKWFSFAGTSVYGSRRTFMTESKHSAGPVTEDRSGKLYLHVFRRGTDTVRIDGLELLNRAVLLNSGKELKVSCVGGKTWEISGFDGNNIDSQIPETILLEDQGTRGPCAVNLLPEQKIELKKSDTPILGLVLDDSRRVLPEGRLLTTERFAENNIGESVLYPDWKRNVLRGNTVSFTPDFSGYYRILIGFIAAKAERKILNPGLPDTLDYGVHLLSQGESFKIDFASGCPMEIYAVKLIPQWESIPVEKWQIAGAFSTDYKPWNMGTCIQDAMSEPFTINDSGVIRADGTSRKWVRADRKGEFDKDGMDFLFHTELNGRNLSFGKVEIASSREQDIEAVVFCDWWAAMTLNGKKVFRIGGPATKDAEFSTDSANLTVLHLLPKKNELIVRNHCGIGGSNFCLFLNRYQTK